MTLRQREERERDPEYLAWVAALFCLPCMVESGVAKRGVHVCHIRLSNAGAGWLNPGMQQKPHDRRVWPGCPAHHLDGPRAQHRMNEDEWWERMGVDPVALVSALNKAYDHGRSGNAVIAHFAGRAKKAKGAVVATHRRPS